jgi:hypothetical protein
MSEFRSALLALAILWILYLVVQSASRRPHVRWDEDAKAEWDQVYFGAMLIDDGNAEFEYWRQCMLREYGDEIEPQLVRYFKLSKSVATHPKSEWRQVIEDRFSET